MFGQTEKASDTYQLLDASPPQDKSSTPTHKPLARASPVEVLDEQISAFQVGTNDQPSVQFPGWSSKPRMLGKSKKSLFLDLALNVLMVLMSLPFLVLAAAVASVHGKGFVQSEYDTLLQATKTASTLFTLVFAAILGRAAKKYATWRLERGSNLGPLEQVMQSRTLSATISTQISLRSFGPLGACLLSIWALSPLGSQSYLRILSTGLKPTKSNRKIHYVDTMANEMFGQAPTFTGILNLIYVASILSPPSVKSSSMDLWGNVKIPYLSNSNDINSDRWLQVLDPVPEYSSLLGIPLGSMKSGNTTLSLVLESTYIGVDCSAPKIGPEVSVIYNTSALFSNEPSVSNGTFWSLYTAALDHRSPPSWTLATDVFVHSNNFPGDFVNATNLEVNQSRLLFQSARFNPGRDSPQIVAANSSDGFTVVYCDLSQIYVGSNVTCSKNDGTQNCTVIAQRPSQLPHASSNLTTLSFTQQFENVVFNLIQATIEINNKYSSSIAEYYLQNTSSSFILGNSGPNPEPASLDNVSAAAFGQRLGQLLNTYMLGSQIYNIVSGDQGSGFDFLDAEGYPQGTGRNATASLTQLHEVYMCSWGWLAALILASSTMLAASLLATWWDLQTRIPDILGYCSTLTRDAPYLNLQGGNTLDGMERTRMLRDYRITLGVVDEATDESVSHIAVAPAGKAKRPVKGKLYV